MSRLKPNAESLEFNAIRASGPGGQHVNKVATAVELRFDISTSTLPAAVKQRLLDSRDRRVSGDGVVVIKAQRYRSQEKNRQDALDRLQGLIDAAATTDKPRKPARPGRGAVEKRIREKKKTGDKKAARGPVRSDD